MSHIMRHKEPDVMQAKNDIDPVHSAMQRLEARLLNQLVKKPRRVWPWALISLVLGSAMGVGVMKLLPHVYFQ